MDAQFIAAAMEAVTMRHTDQRLETYAAGLAIAHELQLPLVEYRIDGDRSNYSRAFRFALQGDRFDHGGVAFIGTKPHDYVWVLIEGDNTHGARVRMNLAGSFDDLKDEAYQFSKSIARIGWLDIPAWLDTTVRDLVAVHEEVAA